MVARSLNETVQSFWSASVCSRLQYAADAVNLNEADLRESSLQNNLTILSTLQTLRMTASVIPLFPCSSLGPVLAFYEAIGFRVTYRQEDPYLYGGVSYGTFELNFSRLTMFSEKKGFGSALVFVPDVAPALKAFADGLRTTYGKVPTAGAPRISRPREGQTRFHLFDPEGNMLVFINQDEADGDYNDYTGARSELAAAMNNAQFLRDTYVNDKAAAKTLDKALEKHPQAASLERALALAFRAELAVALGEADVVQLMKTELAAIVLTEEERAQHYPALHAAEALEQWIHHG